MMAPHKAYVVDVDTKRKRVFLTVQQKIDICRKLESGVCKTVLMKDYHVGRTTLYDIQRQKDKFLGFVSNSDVSQPTEDQSSIRMGKLQDLDTVLYKWYLTKRVQACAVTDALIIDKAKHFYELMKVKEPCEFSDGWLHRFKKRHGIRKVDVHDDHVPTREKTVKSNLVKYWKDAWPEIEQLAEVKEATSGKETKEDIVEVISEAPTCRVKAEEVMYWKPAGDGAPTVRAFTDQELASVVLPADKESHDDEGEQEEKCGWEEADQSFQTLIKFMERNEAYSTREVSNMQSNYKEFLKRWCKTSSAMLMKVFDEEIETS